MARSDNLDAVTLRLHEALAAVRATEGSGAAFLKAFNKFGAELDPASRRALRVAGQELAGIAHEKGGRPPVQDDESIANVRSEVADGKDLCAAIRDEARRLARRSGKFDSHRRRLERKMKISGQNP